MKKKVLILYATYGNGHKVVADNIYNYLSSKKVEAKKIDILDYIFPPTKILSKTFFEKTMFSKIPIIWHCVYKFYNNKVCSLGSRQFCYQLFDKKKLRRQIKDFNPDIIISSHFFASMLASRYIKSGLTKAKLYTIITDFKIHEFWTKSFKEENAIIVSSKQMQKELIEKGVPKNKIKIYGIPVAWQFYEKKDINSLKKKYNISNNKITILFFGGGNNSLSSLPFLKKLIASNLNYQVFFITGNNKRLKIQAEKAVLEAQNQNIQVLGFCDSVDEYMSCSDLVITKPGGLTVSECLALKKPMLLINYSAGQEKDNYKYLVENNYAIKTSNPHKFEKVLKEIFTNPHILKSMQRSLKLKEHQNSLASLIKLILK